MNEVSAIALQAMQQDMTRLNNLSNNVANLSTPGYKRSVSVSAVLKASFASFVTQNSETAKASTIFPEEPLVSVSLDTKPGSLRSTGQSLDIALEGQGYLEVATPQGNFYTRQGNLRTDAQGRLVTAQGYPVMGISGDITLKQANPSIDANGAIRERGLASEMNTVGQLKIVDFENSRGLTPMGDGLFAAADGLTPFTTTTATVKQGYLENSNANSMQEMVQMIQTMRHFESMHKIAQGYDDMLSTAIRKLGETA